MKYVYIVDGFLDCKYGLVWSIGLLCRIVYYKWNNGYYSIFDKVCLRMRLNLSWYLVFLMV